jgi:predicted peptidase
MVKRVRKKTRLAVWLAIMIFGFAISTVCAAFIKTSPKIDRTLQKLLQAAPDFHDRIFHDETGRFLRYRILEPLEVDTYCQYPLVIFLGGSGERGDNNIRQLKFAGPFFNNLENRQKYPCFVVIPQCPAGQNWVRKESYCGTVPLAPEATEPAQLTVKLILSLERHLNVDSKRIYLMGISSGASGVWDLASRYPEMFAAAVPFAGCGDVNQAARLTRTPVWIFHGAWDLAVNPKCSRLMDQALLKAGGKPRYTEYPMTSHLCWVKAFRDPELLCWLFAQQRL